VELENQISFILAVAAVEDTMVVEEDVEI
jgi:hypothetical protein